MLESLGMDVDTFSTQAENQYKEMTNQAYKPQGFQITSMDAFTRADPITRTKLETAMKDTNTVINNLDEYAKLVKESG